MKYLILTLLCLQLPSWAGEITQNFSSGSWEKAKRSSNRLQFIVESTKVGIFSSDVDGYVKNFSYKADLDEKNGILRNMVIQFQVKDMDTDDEDRDEKLHNKCMGIKNYPTITVNVPGPLFIKGKRMEKLKGTVNIRGKDKEFLLFIRCDLKGNKLNIIANTTWSLKKMEIPDPSIAVASLSDEIRVNIRLSGEVKGAQ